MAREQAVLRELIRMAFAWSAAALGAGEAGTFAEPFVGGEFG